MKTAKFLIIAAGIIFLSAKVSCSEDLKGGSSFQTLSQTVVYMQMDTSIELQKIEQQRAEAKAASQKGMDAGRLAEIKAQADRVIAEAWRKIRGQKEAMKYGDGAMILVSCQVISSKEKRLSFRQYYKKQKTADNTYTLLQARNTYREYLKAYKTSGGHNEN